MGRTKINIRSDEVNAQPFNVRVIPKGCKMIEEILYTRNIEAQNEHTTYTKPANVIMRNNPYI